MGIVHQAYTFDAASFHADLWKSVALKGSLSIDLMRRKAKQAAQHANRDTKEFLRLICFEESWLEADDDDAHQFTYMYLVALAARINQPRPLANLSFAALELALPKLGVDLDDVRLLLCGECLHSLAESSGVAALAGRCSRDLCHISWLSARDARRLKFMLLKHRRQFEAPGGPLIETVANLPKDFLGAHSPVTVLRNAYQDMAERLLAAHGSNACLILINDVGSYQVRQGPGTT